MAVFGIVLVILAVLALVIFVIARGSGGQAMLGADALAAKFPPASAAAPEAAHPS